MRQIFLVFEGGGAKGIVHVGALQALEERKADLAIGGVAGTSAGAIVAALVAAGYTSEELIDKRGGSPLVERMGLAHAKDMFGRDWDRLALLRWAASDPLVAFFILLLPGVALAALCFWWHAFHWFWAYEIHWAASILYGFVACAVLIFGLYCRLVRGAVRLDFLIDNLERALASKLGLPEGERVYFHHMDRCGRPLRLVATDLAARELKLFSTATSPNVRVAEAVAASAALPIACASVVIEGRRYVDGGIVSNLPAWTFDEARAIDPDAITVCVSIDGGAPAGDPEKIGPITFLFSIFFAAMFGRRQLETRAAPRLFALNLKTKVQLVDFDMAPERAKSEVKEAKDAAVIVIRDRLFDLPETFREACRKIREQLDRRVPPATVALWRTRVLIAVRDEGATSSWRIQYGSGLEDTDSDDQLLLPDASSLVGWAARNGTPAFDRPPFTAYPGVALEGRENRYRRALVRRDLAWCMAVPIYSEDDPADAQPSVVLSLDSNLEASYFGFNEGLVLQIEVDAHVVLQPALKLLKDIEKLNR